MGFGGVITSPKWPAYDEEKCREDSVEIAVQVNGKIKTRITVPADIGEAEAVAAARADAKTAATLEGMQVLKEIYVMPAEQFKNIIIATVYQRF